MKKNKYTCKFLHLKKGSDNIKESNGKQITNIWVKKAEKFNWKSVIVLESDKVKRKTYAGNETTPRHHREKNVMKLKSYEKNVNEQNNQLWRNTLAHTEIIFQEKNR